MEVVQRTLKADLCHFNRCELTRVPSARSVKVTTRGGNLPSVQYPREPMKASTLVCWKTLHVCLLCLGWKPPRPKWKRTRSLMSQWNLEMNTKKKTHFSVYVCLCCEGGAYKQHTQAFREVRGRFFFFLASFCLCTCWACLHRPVTSPPQTDREKRFVWEEDGSLVNT